MALQGTAETEDVTNGFENIIDPEMGVSVPIDSRVGQQVLKNYIECIKNGSDSPGIVSTKMFYKQTKTQTAKGSRRGTCPKCKKGVFTSQQRIKTDGVYYHEACFEKQ